MTETIASAAGRFIEHKRAHGRKYHSEARELALLVRFAAGRDVSCLGELTPALLEDFLASRPRLKRIQYRPALIGFLAQTGLSLEPEPPSGSRQSYLAC